MAACFARVFTLGLDRVATSYMLLTVKNTEVLMLNFPVIFPSIAFYSNTWNMYSKFYHFLIQVKEACRKASEAEELAKTRLKGMNYDLSIHCRITVSTG